MWMDIAYAAGSQGARGMGELFNSVFLFLPLIAIFYFMIFRPQQKQRKDMQQMLANLKKATALSPVAASRLSSTKWKRNACASTWVTVSGCG